MEQGSRGEEQASRREEQGRAEGRLEARQGRAGRSRGLGDQDSDPGAKFNIFKYVCVLPLGIVSGNTLYTDTSLVRS